MCPPKSGSGTSPADFFRGWPIFGLLLVVLLITPVSTVWMVVGLYDDIPSQDQLSFFVHDKLGEGLYLGNLFAFLNQHQMVFTRLVVYLDYAYFHGSNLLPYVANALLLLAVWAVYCVVLRQSASAFSRQQFMVLCGLFLTLYFNGRMLLNLTFPIMEFPWTSCLAASAFLLFCRLPFVFAGADRHSRLPRVILLATTLVAAALSCAGGLLAGPSLLLVTAALPLWSKSFPRRSIWRLGLIILGLTCLITAVYAGAYFAMTGGHGSRPIFDLIAIGRFICVFVGGPFFNDSEWPIVSHANPFVLYSVCACFWGLLVWLAAQLFRRRDAISAFELFHSCAIVFVLLTAVSGSALRGELSGMEGISKKYTSIALMGWVSAVSLLVYYRPSLFFGKGRWSWLRPLAVSWALVLILVPGDMLQFRMWQVWRAQVRQTASAVASGVYSSDLLRRLYHDKQAGYDTSQAFVREGKYCYRRMPSPGYSLRQRFHVTEPSRSIALTADVTSITEQSGRQGFTASGITGDLNDEFPALVVTDYDDHVVGYGMVTAVSFADGRTRRSGEWFTAFRRPPGFNGAGAFRVYDVRGDYARLAGTLAVSDALEVDPRLKSASTALLRVADNTDYSLDVFNGVGAPMLHQPIRVPLGGEVDIVGWAVDRERNALPAAVDAVIDGQAWPAQIGARRDDVAAYFHKPGFAKSGYYLALPAATLGAGQHQLRIRVYTGGARFHLDSAACVFVVE